MLEHLNAKEEAPSRVVIIGAGGFVGGAVAKRLERDGISVLKISRTDVNLLAPDAASRLASVLKPGDSVLAASALAPCKNAEMLRDNMILAAALIKGLQAVPLAHVVNVSSDAVYGDEPVPLSETSAAAPGSLHGAMHLARELMFQSEVKAPLATIRPSLLYGAADPHNGYGPNRFRRLNAKGETITLFGEGEERRDHVLIDDLAELTARIFKRRSVGTLNIATGTVTSFREIADLINKVGKAPVPIVPSPRSGPMPHNGYRPFDATATHKAFPDFAYTPLAQGLAQVQQQA
ncbi:MAG: NAD-dependent epimerase/dehydratase family protein [Rhodospirillaceae bacterium]|nr:NAD-dependent epimerase/dehydratase family protein [Rhodospirillaceae bacterium]